MIRPPTAVYRFFDEEDRLVYVGVTDSLGARFLSHSRRGWWPSVVRYTLSWHDDRRYALREETHALKTENPLENLLGVDFDASDMTELELRALPDWTPREPKPRRARGSGSLYQRGSDGLWVAVTPAFGYRGRKTFAAKTAEAALAKRDAYMESA